MIKNLASISLIFLFLAGFCFSINSSTFTGAQGGNISQVNFTLLAHSDFWHVFWGNENSSVSSASITVSNATVANISNSTRLVTFPSTYQYYIISDSSNPFSSVNYTAATTGELDSHFGLSGYESSAYIFNDTSTFRIYNDSVGGYVDLSLPTIYLSGKYSNGTENSQAFRQGVAKIDSSFIFIVPKSSFYGMDNANIDYQFALPYNISSSNNFYLFSVSTPVAATAPPATVIDTTSIPQLSFSWAYDGVSLTVFSSPGASIYARNELGATYNGQILSNGEYKFIAPAGYRYYLYVSKSGSTPASGSIYIPLPTVIVKTKDDVNKDEDDRGEDEKDKTIIIEDTDSGTVLCVGSNCYAAESDDIFESAEVLSELSCSGSICRFVGISEAEFVEKYKLKKIPITLPPFRSDTPSVFDFGQFFQTVGYEISSGLGSSSARPDQDRNFFLYVFTFFTVLAIFLYAIKRRSTPGFEGGYG